jgi:hypothetical protein
VVPSAETICNLAKPTFCLSMKDMRNIIVSSGINRPIRQLTRRSSSMMSCCKVVFPKVLDSELPFLPNTTEWAGYQLGQLL